MPELPEVEVARRALSAWTAGRMLVEVKLWDVMAVRGRLSSRPSDHSPAGAAALAAACGAVGPFLRHGKRLGLKLGAVFAVGHLGMSGRWTRELGPVRHGRVELVLDDGTSLWLVDTRRFAALAVVDDEAAQRTALVAGHGPDALDALPERLDAALDAPGSVKAALMDQARLAGLGNIHVVEALFTAGVAPSRRARSLSEGERGALRAAIEAQLALAIGQLEDDGVAYLSDGAHVANPFRVYQRAGAPCLRCATPVARSVDAGRSTFWCPRCQPSS